MDWIWIAIGIIGGGAAGWLLGTFHSRSGMEPKLRDLEVRARVAESGKAMVEAAARDLSHTFRSLASEALQKNSEGFLTLARTDLEARQKAIEGVLAPVRESLARVDQQIQVMERDRARAQGTLTEQLRALVQAEEKLRSETGNLARALRTPTVRGRWGEIQLKRVVEIAGMLQHCDFDLQASITTADGRLRPDMIVRLPGGKNIVVDAKAPLQAYLNALEAGSEEERLACLREHAQQIRGHLNKLSAKSYWEQLPSTPEFVILFLPGEVFFSAALEQDPRLIEEGTQERVILSTPTTLIALLRATHYGWRQERVAENAQRISDLGRELHERLAIMTEHLGRVGAALSKSVETYNATVASFEGRVLPGARRFQSLGAGSRREIGELSAIDEPVRTPSPRAEEIPEEELPEAEIEPSLRGDAER